MQRQTLKKIVSILTKNPGSVNKELMDDIFNYLEENRDEEIPSTQKITTLSMRKVIGGKSYE